MKLTKAETLLTVVAIAIVILLLYYFKAPKVLPGPISTQEEISEPLKDLTSQITGGTNSYLRGIREVQLMISMNDSARSIANESMLRTELEFNLRRSGLSVIDKMAPYVLFYRVSIQRRDALCIYNSDCHLVERVTFLREEDKPTPGLYQVWNYSLFGTVGASNARDTLIRQAGDVAKEFGQEWAGANAGL